MLERSVVEKCCSEVLEKILEKRVVEKCCSEVLEKRVVEMCGREVRKKTVVEKCWRRVLYGSVGEECWQTWCKRCVVLKSSCLSFLAFNFCWIPLLVETLRLHLCLVANILVHVYAAFCFDTSYIAHLCNLLEHFIYQTVFFAFGISGV